MYESSQRRSIRRLTQLDALRSSFLGVNLLWDGKEYLVT